MEAINANKQEPQLNLDTNARRNFVKFLQKQGEKPVTTVRFFDRTDSYSVHGPEDSDLISRLVYKSTAYIRQLLADDGQPTPYVMLSKTNFELAVRELLLVRNYRVEVYVRRSTGGEWQLEYRGSPGNLLQFEDILFSNKEILVGNSILSLQLRVQNNQRNVGVASVDQNDCLFQVLEFLDDDFFTELEATVVLLGPKECLLPQQDGEYEAVKNLLERNGIMVTVPPKSANTEKNDLIQDLNHLLRFAKGQQEDATGMPELQLNIAMEALRVAIKYTDLVNDAGNLGHYQIKQLNLKRFVHLDAAAVSALNILPKPGTHFSSPSYRWQSVLGVLDHCRTAQGHRLMAQWVKQPLRSQEILNDRHNIVQCFLESPTTLNSLHEEFLKRIPDVLMLTKKLLRQKANLQDIFRIYQVMLRTPKIVNALLALENATVKSVLCDPLKSYLEDLSGLKQMVEQVMDFDAIETGEYLVKASFDSELLEMKERMSKLLHKMEKLQEKAGQELDLDKNQNVKLLNVSHVGYHFRITLRDDSVLRKNKNYKIIDVVKGGIRFTSEKLTEINDEFVTLRTRYEEQQKNIVEEIVKVAVGYAAPLTSLNNEFAQLDCLVSFAIAAQTAPTPYIRPKILPEGAGELVLKDIRHPCLELQEHITFIANNVEFRKDKCNMFIITGPNMGGKSTYIRSVGTAVLMAHVGSFVPCSEATISMVDSILGRVGASDNIIKGLSTFMVEMIETSGIIRSATDKSLVIIDELGRGTSTYEGCGIAWSIAEHLAKETKCFTLFATHFHEITNLADTVKTVKNCHMAAVADNENFTLLYQVRPGVMEKSFGIQVARLANFPERVVQNAQQVYNEFEDEHANKQSQEDKDLLDKINKAIQDLSTTGNNKDINEKDLSQLVEQFTKDIKKLDSEYFKAVLTTAVGEN
ncbi:DNA mismatch repair protein spellchecker 1 [Lucilia cuprina]|uniref:DNA mismatch repair protein spellchecker 1 n=3 Tax=Lucilia cuprina TaxID=7375 RepID=A0A0L0C1K2_LUCCU|nr:DNA mismatch repair protein spellchecker 1 [Lucilia cuprina]KNC25309.1 DNA mismatch repair protein spellchecker 1 [Lucilia cuprina]